VAVPNKGDSPTKLVPVLNVGRRRCSVIDTYDGALHLLQEFLDNTGILELALQWPWQSPEIGNQTGEMRSSYEKQPLSVI
jgi:hypothetical protein